MMSADIAIADHELAKLVFTHDSAGINTSNLHPEHDPSKQKLHPKMKIWQTKQH